MSEAKLIIIGIFAVLIALTVPLTVSAMRCGASDFEENAHAD